MPGLPVGKHAMHYLRGQMAAMRALLAREVEAAADGQRVHVAGAVITRRRPGTAKRGSALSLLGTRRECRT